MPADKATNRWDQVVTRRSSPSHSRSWLRSTFYLNAGGSCGLVVVHVPVRSCSPEQTMKLGSLWYPPSPRLPPLQPLQHVCALVVCSSWPSSRLFEHWACSVILRAIGFHESEDDCVYRSSFHGVGIRFDVFSRMSVEHRTRS